MKDNLLKLKYLYNQKLFGAHYIDEFKTFNTEPKRDLPPTFDALKKEVLNCHLCGLSKSRKNVVFGEGNIHAKLFFIGEGPGASEDETGRPFVGRAGMLLEKIINNVLELKRSDVFIANIVKCRPPNNRVPEPNEAYTCLPYIQKQIELINPQLIISLGATSYRYLTEDDTPISKIRGNIVNFGNKKLIATFHPSYLLRNPSAKREAYQDFLKIKSFL